MKNFTKIVLLLFELFPMSHSFCQSNENDTVFIHRSVHTDSTEIDTIIIKDGISPIQPVVLIGTTFLPYSDKMIGLLNKGLSPISMELVNGCHDSVDPKTFKNYPIFNTVTRDSTFLTIEVTVVANCCHNFLGEAEITGTDTLNLIYTAYGGFCSCTCCFTLKYRFDISMEKYYNILHFVTINGSFKFSEIPNRK